MTEKIPTFSQVQGIEPLPQPLKLNDLPRSIRARLWTVVFMYMSTSKVDDYGKRTRHGVYLGGDWRQILLDVNLDLFDEPPDEFDGVFSKQTDRVKRFIYGNQFNRVFDFLQCVMRHRTCPTRFPEDIAKVLVDGLAAYTVVPDPWTIIPRATPEEGAAVERALGGLKDAGLEGARSHLLKAGESLTGGKFNDSVRESIHAVESVARTLDLKGSTSLKQALSALGKRGTTIHPALKKAMLQMYGYTSDKQGIRHASLGGDTEVGLPEALFMFGACASFVTYLLGKAQESGLDVSGSK